MDDIVKAAMAKWPQVPDCRGWLALDARGDWYMRDDRTQAAGRFPRAKGSRIVHDKLRGFIERNYDRDAAGCWFFQNGPQRVYVELEAAPWVWRLHAQPEGTSPRVVGHTGIEAAAVDSAWLDEHGRLYLAVPQQGLGLVHTLDMGIAADAVEQGMWQPQTSSVDELAERFGHCLSPQGQAES